MTHATVESRKQVRTQTVCRTRWVESFAELIQLIPEWDRLAENSIWRNPSLESNFLIPALKHLNGTNPRVLIVEQVAIAGDETSATGQLIALVPLVKKRIYQLPMSAMEIWKHDQSFDSTPLIRTGYGEPALDAMFNFLASKKIGLLSMNTISAESGLDSVLQKVVKPKGRSLFQRDEFSRAAFRPSESCEKYMTDFTSKNFRKNYRRNHRRLESLGELGYEVSDRHSDFAKLTQQFLELESSGWKGDAGTALGCHESSRQFYEEFVMRSAAAGKARFTSLTIDGRPIAMLSDIESGSTVHAFKTAYDPEFATYSPGLQVEIRNLESMHRDGIQFADSCTLSDNSTINRVWGQRIKFQSVVIGLRPGTPKMATGLMPVIQKAGQFVRTIARRLKSTQSKMSSR